MKIELAVERNQCCGCGACKNVCPQNAITMIEDGDGFVFPKIDTEKCINCGACMKVCHYQNEVRSNNVQSVYAATLYENNVMSSSSGGFFFALSRAFVKQGGCVAGVEMKQEKGLVYPSYVLIDSVENLSVLQGSKYAQARMNEVYPQIKKRLEAGGKVLFSGTPCLVAGLRSFLRKEYNNLYTIDVVCHGVPSAKMFQDYLNFLSEKWNVTVTNYKFRDKQLGWGINMRAYLEDSKGMKKEKVISPEMSAYFSMFLRSDITRDSCIGCKYASSNRVGDISLGDYWGIRTAEPDAVRDRKVDENRGVSAVLVNSTKGKELLRMVDGTLELVPSSYKMMIRHNGQAERPVQAKVTREGALEAYRIGGYKALDRFYWDTIVGKKVFYYRIKNMIPRKLRVQVKRLFKRG